MSGQRTENGALVPAFIFGKGTPFRGYGRAEIRLWTIASLHVSEIPSGPTAVLYGLDRMLGGDRTRRPEKRNDGHESRCTETYRRIRIRVDGSDGLVRLLSLAPQPYVSGTAGYARISRRLPAFVS